jgi:pilus assembly protein CpaE
MRQAMNAVQMLKSPLQSPAPIEKTARPAAGRVRLMSFVLDGRSEASLNSCFSHLSISNATIKRGGIARALEYLSVERSPETIIVDISGSDMPASQVHNLAELCEPGVTVIAIGDRNDVGLYRDLMQAGVSEYIVKPITVQLLAKALSSTPTVAEGSPISSKLGKMVAVVGARGGVGATTLVMNLAWYLANRQNRRVLLLDLDLQNGDCALALNLKPTPGLREALVNPVRIDSVFLERTVAILGDRLFVLSAEEPLRADAEFTAEAVETLVAVLRTQFHYIIADVPRIPAASYRQALDIADVRVIVADQTLRSVRDTVRLRDALGERDPASSDFLVVNRCGEGGCQAVTLEEMAKVKLRPNFVIPFRPKLFTAPGPAGRGAFTEAVAALAAEISGRVPERKQWWRLSR